MTATAQSPAELRDHLLAGARALAPMLREAAAEIDEARQLPPRIVAAMKNAGLFRMSMPQVWGGWEADPVTQNLVIEEVSAANGSAGWCLLIGLTTGFVTGLLDQGIAHAMYPDPNITSATAIVPPGRAVAVEGGFRLSGHWPFASGITHAQWVQATAIIQDEEGTPQLGANGRPQLRLFFVPIGEVEVIDTWHTTGLKGTGSRDFAIDHVFVPAERVVDHNFGVWQRPGAIYRSFNMVLLNHFGVPLGIARDALETYTAAMLTKTAKFGVAPAEERSAQVALATATALVASSRAYAFATLERIWRALSAGRDFPADESIAWRLANAHVHDACAEAIEILQHAAGSVAVYLPNDLDRCFRDIHTVRQHGIVHSRVYEQAGRALFTGVRPPGW